jgi:PAS domain S-box-containing protein
MDKNAALSLDLQTLLDSLPGIAFVKDLQSRYVMVNNQYLEYKGFGNRDRVLGLNDFDLYPASKAGKILAEDRQVLTGGHRFSTEHYNAASDRTYTIIKVPLFDGDGSIAGLLGLSFDISELKRTASALAESERLYKLLAENVQDTIWTRDLSLNYTYISPSVTRMKGWSVEEALTLPLDQVLTPASIERSMNIYAEELARDGEPGVDPNRSMLLLSEEICKDGSIIWTESSLTFLRDENGRPKGVLGVTRDITERRSLEAQLSQSQRMEAVGRLAGGVAHDFNNILSVILSYSDFVRDGLPEDSPLRADADEIIKAGRRATELTRQLLAFSRREIIKPQVIDTTKALKGMEKLLRRTLGESVKLNIEVAAGIKNIKLDPGHFDNVIFNLAVNAVDAMPKGGLLEIAASNFEHTVENVRALPGLRPGLFVLIRVTDTGCGMTEETIQHLFEPFFTTKDKARGSGLGLSTLYGIIKNAGGEVFVRSELEKGSSFSIYLPAYEAVDEEGVEKPSLPSGTQLETVLLVEDDDVTRRVAQRILLQKGFTVIPAQGGPEALALSKGYKGKIHLVVTDVVMPGMSGKELAEVFEELRPDMKVLYMSGHTDDVVTQHGISPGESNFLKKPFTKDGLLDKIARVLSGRTG